MRVGRFFVIFALASLFECFLTWIASLSLAALGLLKGGWYSGLAVMFGLGVSGLLASFLAGLMQGGWARRTSPASLFACGLSLAGAAVAYTDVDPNNAVSGLIACALLGTVQWITATTIALKLVAALQGQGAARP